MTQVVSRFMEVRVLLSMLPLDVEGYAEFGRLMLQLMPYVERVVFADAEGVVLQVRKSDAWGLSNNRGLIESMVKDLRPQKIEVWIDGKKVG